MKKTMMLMIASLYSSCLFASNNLVFDTKTISDSNRSPKYEIKISYPQIHSPNKIAEKDFNETTKKWAANKVVEFKKTLSDWNTDRLPPEMKANGSSLTVNYDLATLNQNQMVSLRFSADSYYVGAAHPSHRYQVLNYDLINNKKVFLDDLFESNSSYLQQIAKIATDKLQTKLNAASNDKVDIFKEGLAPTAKNYEVFNLTPEGFRFTFNEYQVAAYVFGPQEIIIPYTDLNSFYKDGTPLAKCLKNNTCQITISKPAAAN